MNPSPQHNALAVLGTLPSHEALAWTAASPSTHQCLLCGSGGPPKVLASSACATCGSPLAAAPLADGATQERQGRRTALRRGRNHLALLHTGWPSRTQPVRWRDLSITGLSIMAEDMIDIDQVIRISDSAIDVLAQVVECRHQGRLYSVHARILRARFLQTHGLFTSLRA